MQLGKGGEIIIINDVTNNTITSEILNNLWKLGFKLVPLNNNHIPATAWTPIYENINYWKENSLSDPIVYTKFKNVASAFGRTHVKDSKNLELYIQALDIDSENVFHMVNTTLMDLYKNENLKPLVDDLINLANISQDNIMNLTLFDLCGKLTFVTKTKKPYGFHIWWLSHNLNKSILTVDCKKSFEFEIKTDKKSGLCTLPPSTSRNDETFRYSSIGQTERLLKSDSIYRLFFEILKPCLIQKTGNGHTRNNDSRGLIESSLTTFSDLSQESIIASATLLLPFYMEKSRNNFALHFSGYAYHTGVSENSTNEIISNICKLKGDKDLNERLSTGTYLHM